MMDKTPVSPAPPRRRFWWRLLLAVSLALNLLVLGALAGAGYRHYAGDAPGLRHPAPELRSYATPYVRALPRDAQRALHDALRRAGGAPPSRAERRALYERMLRALRAETLDLAEVKSILQTQRDAVLRVQGSAQDIWLAQISEMSAAERADYADHLERHLRAQRRGRRPPKRE
jgi:uncharacterized membrane protein